MGDSLRRQVNAASGLRKKLQTDAMIDVVGSLKIQPFWCCCHSLRTPNAAFMQRLDQVSHSATLKAFPDNTVLKNPHRVD